MAGGYTGARYEPAGIVHYGEALIRDSRGNVVHVQYGPGEPTFTQLTLEDFNEMTKENE